MKHNLCPKELWEEPDVYTNHHATGQLKLVKWFYSTIQVMLHGETDGENKEVFWQPGMASYSLS